MTAIRKNLSGNFEVYGRKNGKRFSKSFKTRAEAKKYIAILELSNEEKASLVPFSTLLDEYLTQRTIFKKSARSESIRINAIKKYKIATIPISEITEKSLEDYFNERRDYHDKTKKTELSNGTILREIGTIGAVFNYAVEKNYIKSNPVSRLKKPKEPDHRERVASDEEIEKLFLASGWDGVSVPKNKMQLTILAFLFSCRTGMRAGEILNLEEAWIENNVIHLPKEATKTNARRDVALSSDALRLLNLVRELKNSPKLFGVLNSTNRDALFRKARDRAGLGAVFDSNGNLIKEGLNFHDGRATFATWAASPDPETGAPRLDVLALARQTGHKDLKMLQRYYRPNADEIAKRLK